MGETRLHTPIPWKVSCGTVFTEDDRPIANMIRDDSALRAGIMPVERDQNAHFVVLACNSHDELLEACRAFKFMPDCGGYWCEEVERGLKEGCKYGHLCCWAYALETQFKAAIAKATEGGEQTKTYVECGCCGSYHREDYHGDCRNDDERFEDVPGDAIIISVEEQMDEMKK